MKEKLETLTLQMQFFCLDPQWKIYQEICGSAKLQMQQSHVFDLWKMAALAANGSRWRAEGVGDLSASTLARNLAEYIKAERALIAKWKHTRVPKANDLDRIWYIFFANGKFKYLQLGFTAAVKDNADIKFSKTAIDMFDGIHSMYLEKVRELCKNGSWDRYRKITSVSDCVKSLAELDEEMTANTSRLRSAGFDPKKHSVADLGDLFDDEMRYVDAYDGGSSNSEPSELDSEESETEIDKAIERLAKKHGMTKPNNAEMASASALFDKIASNKN